MMQSAIVTVTRRMSRRWMPVLWSALAVMGAAPAWAASSTTTSLFTSPQSPSSGSVITMTAQVQSVQFTVAGGSVTFTDTYNGVTENLGTVQVQSTLGSPGTAVLNTEVGGVGVHQFTATYNGTQLFSSSSSSPQSVTFIAPYLSSTKLASTGTNPTKFTATVSAFGPTAPTGSVTFTNTTSNQTLGTVPLDPSTLQTGFTSSQNYAIANMDNGNTGDTIGPALGDFNGDGRPDFAVPTNGGPIVIELGKGDGTFTVGTPINTTGNFTPTSAVVGDFNGDGKQDLAILNAKGTGSVNIYLGNGNGTFQAARNYPIAASASSSRLLAIGDFNQDGFQDLVATNHDLNNVGVILGNGDGTFNSPAYYAVAAQPWNVVVGDINGDGIADLAVASDGTGSASILQGNGDGTFKTAINFATGASQVGSVALGDFNKDGYLDLATTSAPDNGVYILLNKKTATPSFGSPTKINMNSGPYYLTIGDFDRDGDLDIISANNGNSTVAVLLGNGNGSFGTPTYYTVAAGSIWANEADINGDDQVDLTAVTNNGLSVLLSGQSEQAKLSVPLFYGCGQQSITATYGGDGNYGSSTSNALTFTPTAQDTNLALTVTPADGVQGQQRILQATLSPYAYGSQTTNGETITFTDNGLPIGTATLSGGVAVLNVVLNGFNIADVFRASYAGDCAFNSSRSGRVNGTTLFPSHLTWATPSPITYGTALSDTQLNAVDDAPGGGTYTYTPAKGTVLSAGTQTLSVTFNPNNPLYGNVTTTVQLVVNQATPFITWPTPAAIAYGTPLSGFQLNATVSGGVVQVPFGGTSGNSYNVNGIYPTGASYNTGGFDNDGYSYSSSTLGSTLVWNGMTFAIGAPSAPDAVANTTINLPTGNFTSLYMLGAMVNNITTNPVTFKVTYTDNTTQTFTQNMSDWFNAAGYSGESVITCQEDRNFKDGSTQPDSVCVYGYQIPLNVNKTVQSLTLPNTRNIVMLAFDLTTPSIPGTLVYTPPAGTVEPVGTDTLSVSFTPTDTVDYTSASATVQLVVQNAPAPIVTPTISWPQPANIPYGTPLSSVQLNAVAMGTARATPAIPINQLNVISTATDGTRFSQPGFDNNGLAYSYDQLGNGSVNFGGSTYTLGQPTVPNAITNGAVYTLPTAASYSTVFLLGAATTNGQTHKPFTLKYSDGSISTQYLDMSSWSSSAGYADETIVKTTDHANNQSGGSVSGTYRLYGYQLTADPSKNLVSVTLPSTRNIVIMALGFGTGTQVVVPGTYNYNPASGTVLSVGTHTLNVTFTPSDSTGYTGATGSTQITVVKATPVINWPTPAAISPTTPLSSVQLNATATFNGAPLAGTYFYTIPPSNADAHGKTLSPGTYTLKVVFTPTDTADFTTATATVQIVVGTTGSTGISGSPAFASGDCCFFSQPTPYTITVTGSTVAPTGTVTVVFKGQTIGTGTLTPGSGATSTANLRVNSIYLYPGNNNVTLNYLGDTHYVPLSSAAVIPLRNPAITANPATVNGTTSTISISYAYVDEGTAVFNFNPGGGNASDFTNISASQNPACQSNQDQIAGTICTLSVRFRPGLPGIRKGVIEVNFTDKQGNPEPKLYLFLSGLGSAAQISLDSATQLVLNSTLNQPQSVTFDPTDLTNSKLFAANSNAGQLVTLPSSGGPLTRWNAANSGNLSYPGDLVFDPFGNLVVPDAGNAKIYSFSPALAESTIGTGTLTLGMPTASRFDLAGNLYVADGGNTPQIIQVPGETYDTIYSPTKFNLGSNSVSFPQALAVDNAGTHLYIGDGDLNQILQVNLDGSGSTPVAVAPCATGVVCSLNSPAGIAFDPNGDMFITDSNARVLMIPAAHSNSNKTIQLPFTGLTNPAAVILDGSGDVYVSDLNGTVNKLQVNSGSLTFPSLNSTLTTTITNTGNLPLSITSVSLGSGGGSAYSVTGNGCSGTVAAGANCTITLKYSNRNGSPTDTLTINSNAFSLTGVTVKLNHN
jgi:hypothetical protein